MLGEKRRSVYGGGQARRNRKVHGRPSTALLSRLLTRDGNDVYLSGKKKECGFICRSILRFVAETDKMRIIAVLQLLWEP